VTLLFPRLYYAMARDGLFFAAMGELHPTFGTPARAIGLQALVASILIAVGTFPAIVAYFVFVTVAFLGLTVAGLFVLRARQHPPVPSYRVPGYPVTPILFLVLTALVLGLLAGGRPKESMIGLLVVALGIPVFQRVGRRRGTVAGERGGQG
jgi:basic amino acid/polyamine antiporter, APA family